MSLPTLAALDEAIAKILDARDGADNFQHLYVPSERLVERLGFALEPVPGLLPWVQEQHLDALFIHRPWRLQTSALPPGTGVIAYHQPLDASLAVGYNRHLAAALGMHDILPLGEKDGTPLGMIGDVAPQTWEAWEAHVRQEFVGIERVSPPYQSNVARVAVMGAMNDMLVRDAFGAHADVYLTGQMRVPGQEAVKETGIGVIAVGHARGEHWGLRMLASLLRQKFPTLVTVVR